MIYRFRRHDVRQEEDVVSRRNVVLGFSVATGVSLLLIAVASLLLHWREGELRESRVFPEVQLGPRREIQGVQQDLFGGEGFGAHLNAQKKRILGTYAWVDRHGGIVAIPIDDAMSLVVEENR